jgi:hypothetical protein
MRLRILAGSVLLVAGLAVYAAAIAAVGGRFLPDRVWLDLLFYGIAGIAWIAPAALLTRWMSQAAPHHPPGAKS